MSALRRLLTLLSLLVVLPGCHTLHHRACKPGPAPCQWAGIYPTVVAPFCGEGVDTASLERQIRHELKGGVHGLLVLGTIGEGEYTTDAERAQVIATAVKTAKGCVPVVVGIHTCDVGTAKAQLLQAKELGADAVLVKYIGNPKAKPGEVLGFFVVLSELNTLPIFYYHYPSQTGLKLSPRDVANILCLPGVVGIKESTLDLRETQEHVKLTRGQGKVFLSGTALNLTQFMEVGGHGAMCPEAVLLPGPTAQAYEAQRHGRHAEALALQRELFKLMPVLRASSTPTTITRCVFMMAQNHKIPLPLGGEHPQARIKYALNCIGVPTPTAVTCPLPALTARDKQNVNKAMGRVKCIDWGEVACPVPPVPLKACPAEDEGGMLLKTGGIQLAPGVGRDQWGWQSDGRGGF